MNPDPFELDRAARTLFLQALERHEPGERGRFLDDACAAQPALRARVEVLLASHRDDSFLDQPATVLAEIADNPTPAAVHPIEGPGSRIGRYRLQQQIGEGGMGVVYMAEQEEPVRRQVALKIIKLGMDTRQIVARFEAERQALALMDHPNISKVLDAGSTDTGRPYFVMELVRGVPITEYCDRNQLPAQERLELFIAVCQAVQHAHQKGIIHRDIKPSNVLVTLHDGVPVPKVIDFGIAKAIHQRLTEKTLFTQFAQMIGTPAYMSPEQAEMSGLDIDTRSDVYSLGVLLYELLTGTTPFPNAELLRLGYAEIQRVIAAKEPPRPSTRLSTMSGDERTVVARNRNVAVGQLERLSRGDLDWIVMRSLEKDRTRRYETANALAADVRRHLNNEPVTAAAPTFGYQLLKFYRRNRALMRLAAGAAVLSLAATLFSSWQALRATRAERRATLLREQAESARSAESSQRSIAEQRVYDSLVREARAVRLARKVGYRDRVFALLQQAAKIAGARKDVGELRREAVACLGDFVGATPVTWTNFPDGFLIMEGRLSPSGELAVLKLWKKATGEGRLLVRETATGKEWLHETAVPDSSDFAFIGASRLGVIHLPEFKGNEFDRKRYQDAVVTTWGPGPEGRWHEISREPFPGASRFVDSPVGILLAIDDPARKELRLEDPVTRAVRHRFTVPDTQYRPEVWIAGDGRHAVLQVTGPAPELRAELLLIRLADASVLSRRQLEATERFADFSSDGEHFLTSTPGKGQLTTYTTTALEPVGHLLDMNVGGRVTQLPRQKTVAVATYLSREVRLIDFLQQETLARLDEPRNPFDVEVSADGRTLLTVGVLYARVYRLPTEPHRQLIDASVGSSSVVLHPDGRHIAITYRDGSIALVERQTGRTAWRREGVPCAGPRFSEDGNWLMASNDRSAQRLTILDARTGQTALELGSGEFGFMDAAMSRNGRHLVTFCLRSGGGWDGDFLLSDDPSLGTLHAYELSPSPGNPAKLEARVLSERTGKYCSATFLGNSSRAALLDADAYPSAYTWDLASPNAPLSKLPLEPAWSFWNLAPMPDGKSLWSIDRQGRLVLFDLEKTATRLVSVEGIDRLDFFGIQGGVVSRDGTKLAVASTATRSAEIFDAHTGRLLYTLPAYSSVSFLAEWTPDSQGVVVTRFNGGESAIWDLRAIERTLTELGLGVP